MAKKEYRSNLSNRWIILIAVTFLGLSVLISFYGTASETSDEWIDLQRTVRYLTAYIEYMVPIFGVILGYGSIVREKEKGTLELLLSYPVDRGEVLAGKFLGLWALLVTCVIGGLGLGGVVISRQVEEVVWAEYYLFMLSSIILGGIYISISLMLSVIFEDSTSSMAASIFVLFLYSFLWLFAVYAVAELTFGWDVLKSGNPPKWYFGIQLFNPVILWYTLLALNVPSLREWAMEFGGEEPQYHPHFYDTWMMIVLLLIWMTVPLLLGEYIFKRKQIT